MYGGRPLKGSLFLACYLLSWILGLTVYPAVAMLIAIAVITIWSPIHGFKSARAWNLAHGIES
jgi:hypothetical protein